MGTLDGATIKLGEAKDAIEGGGVYVGAFGDGKAGLVQTPTGPALVITATAAQSPSQFVTHAPDFDHWRAALFPNVDPQRPLAGVRLHYESAAPDPALAVACLARRLRGEPIPADWIDYGRRWQAGHTRNIGSVLSSWGPLHVALVAPLYPSGDHAEPDRATALVIGVAFVEALLAAGCRPDSVPDPNALPDGPLRDLLFDAHNLVQAEQAAVDAVIAGANRVELSLPMRGMNRRRPMSALFLVERNLSGVLKVLLRQEGYLFLGIWRTAEKGSRFEKAFSVEPGHGVCLEELHAELQRREQVAAAGAPAGRWDDEEGRFTILYSPQHNSRLSWEDALAAVWSCYAPVNQLHLTNRSKAPVDITGPAKADNGRDKRQGSGLIFCDLVSRRDQGQPLAWSSTVARALANFIETGTSSIETLPAESEFDAILNNDGAIIVSSKGVAFVEFAEGTRFTDVRNAASDQERLLARAIELEGDLSKLAKELESFSTHRNAGKERAILTKLGVITRDAGIALARQDGAPRPASPLVVELEDAIAKRWQAKERFKDVQARAKELRELLMALNSSRTAEAINFLTVVGLPFSILVNLFDWSVVSNPKGASAVEIPYTGMAVQFGPLIVWILVSLFIAGVIRLAASAYSALRK